MDTKSLLFYDKVYSEERALYNQTNIHIKDCIFRDGESPLKEGCGITAQHCLFKWRYPIWYCRDVRICDCVMYEGARAAIWYTNNIDISGCCIDAPKTLRRCNNVRISDTTFSAAPETLWLCDKVLLKNTSAKGDYFAMNSSNIEVDNLNLTGKYSFDGVKNVIIKNSRLITKDAFWNSENVTVYDSIISGEYLGWNAKNLTFINCTIESLQGLCYIDNLIMRNCKMPDTTLAFEYSSVDAEIDGHINSVFNPTRGTITADSIGELILDSKKIDVDKVKINIKNKN